jgi:uncharacterized protein DUF1844
MNDKPFTVNDRRHFTPEGQAREDDPAPAAVKDAPRSGAPQAAEGAERAPAKADLTSFLISLATQAGLLLDGGSLPEGMSVAEGRAGAQSIISILEMLQDKTEGRRTDGETDVLARLLYELRMAYVAKARVTGA